MLRTNLKTIRPHELASETREDYILLPTMPSRNLGPPTPDPGVQLLPHSLQSGDEWEAEGMQKQAGRSPPFSSSLLGRAIAATSPPTCCPHKGVSRLPRTTPLSGLLKGREGSLLTVGVVPSP